MRYTDATNMKGEQSSEMGAPSIARELESNALELTKKR